MCFTVQAEQKQKKKTDWKILKTRKETGKL